MASVLPQNHSLCMAHKVQHDLFLLHPSLTFLATCSVFPRTNNGPCACMRGCSSCLDTRAQMCTWLMSFCAPGGLPGLCVTLISHPPNPVQSTPLPYPTLPYLDFFSQSDHHILVNSTIYFYKDAHWFHLYSYYTVSAAKLRIFVLFTSCGVSTGR